MDSEDTLNSVEILNEHSSEVVDDNILRSCIAGLIAREALQFKYLNIILTDHSRHRTLNKLYLNHDYYTDVLAFPLHEPGAKMLEGEIYIDLDTARERHVEFNTRFETEVLRYAIHGVLHLAGYEDKTQDGKLMMRALEDQYLSSYS